MNQITNKYLDLNITLLLFNDPGNCRKEKREKIR